MAQPFKGSLTILATLKRFVAEAKGGAVPGTPRAGRGCGEYLFVRFDQHLSKSAYLAVGGYIVEATVVAELKQHNTDDEKVDIKTSKIPDDGKDKPAKLRQKDREAR